MIRCGGHVVLSAGGVVMNDNMFGTAGAICGALI